MTDASSVLWSEERPVAASTPVVPVSELPKNSRRIAQIVALAGSDEGIRAVPQVSPWARHLSADEVRVFVADLVDALRDTTGLDVRADLYRVIGEWRATARSPADPETGRLVDRTSLRRGFRRGAWTVSLKPGRRHATADRRRGVLSLRRQRRSPGLGGVG